MYIAIDDNNHKVNVDSATKEGLYYCPICKSKLIVKDGECRTKHFAHIRALPFFVFGQSGIAKPHP